MHEYGWTVDYTMLRPLGQCFALYAAIDARYGNDPKGPAYVEQDIISTLANARACSHEIEAQRMAHLNWTAARKEEARFAYRVAMPRHCLSRRNAFSTRCLIR